jgi:hypothetical protein
MTPTSSTLPALDPPAAAIRVEKDRLVVPNDSKLPDICLKCGAHAPLEWVPRRFYYRPWWARAAGATVIGLVVTLLATRRSRPELPFCSTCNAARKRRDVIGWLSWIPGVALMVTGAVVAGCGSARTGAFLMLGGMVVFFLFLIVAALIGTAGEIRMAKIEEGHTWLVGVVPQAMSLAASARSPSI